MALNKVYTRINWEDYPSENTDLDAYNLNQMDSAIDALDNRIISQDALKVDKSAINGNIADWTMDETTGVITITKYNGEKVIFDLNIEKIPVEFSMSDDGIITMTTEDGTQFKADIGSMIPVLTFEDSATIAVSVTGTGKNKTYSFSIKTGSVTDAMLQPNYLADIRVESANASAYAQSANAKSVLAESYAVGGTGTREGEDTDNAKYYMEQAKQQTGGIPTKVSELENDVGYITKSVSNLTNYYDKTDVDKKIDEIPKTDLTNYLTKTGDGSNLTAAFEEATTLEELTTGEKLSSIFGKLKLAVKNLKSLISLIGTTDISTIGDGTITGGLSDVNGNLKWKTISNATQGTSIISLPSDYEELLIKVNVNAENKQVVVSIPRISLSNDTDIIKQGWFSTSSDYGAVQFDITKNKINSMAASSIGRDVTSNTWWIVYYR